MRFLSGREYKRSEKWARISRSSFFDNRQQRFKAFLQEEDQVISTHMVRWAEHLPHESIVLVNGTVQKATTEITSASISNIELLITQLHLVARPVKLLPFDVYDAEEVEIKHTRDDNTETPIVNHRMRLSNRLIDLRTPTSQSIFRINAAVCNIFRNTLTQQNFLEIHTPKLQAAAA